MQSRFAIAFLLTTLSLDAIGFGLIMPVMPDLLREVTGEDLSNAALWGGVLFAGFATMQFLFGPVIGNLSDRFGRKPILLISLVVMSGDYVVLALAGSIWLIFVARLVTGISSSTYGTCMAYIADISTPQERAQRFGLMGAAFGVGFVLGPAVGGVLAEYGLRAPFVAAAVVAGVNAAFGALVMRESLLPENRRSFDWRRANPFGAFKHIGRLPGLGRFLTIYTIYEFAFTVYPVIWSYFAVARFGWTPGQIGLSLAYFGVSFALIQGWLIRVLLRRFDRRFVMTFGLAAAAASFVVLTFVQNGTLALIMIPVTSLSGLVMPALRAEMSDRVSASQQGELQGALGSLHSLGLISAPVVYSATFAAFTASDAYFYSPGAVFAIPAALNILSIVLLWRHRRERTVA